MCQSTLSHVLAGIIVGLFIAFFVLSLVTMLHVFSINKHLFSIEETLNEWELTE